MTIVSLLWVNPPLSSLIVPATTFIELWFLPDTQAALVIAHRVATNAPPQKWTFARVRNESCDGI